MTVELQPEDRPRGHGARRYATVSGRTPLVTIAPGRTYRWSRVSRPVLRHGSTRSLEAGSCTFYALPPRDPP